MKKITGWYAVLATCVISLLTGCSDQECVESPAALGKVVLTGSAETKNVSRSALSDKGVFSWLEGDKIDVYASDGQFHEFTLTDGAGSGVGDFSAELVEGTEVGGYAISPAGLSPVVADGGLKVTLPSEYVGSGSQTHALMLAEVNSNLVHFKNLGGLVKLTLNDIKNGCRIEVTSATHQLAGTMAISQDAEGNHVLKSTESTSGNQITFTSTSTDGKQSFYLPLPTTDDKIKLNVKVYDAAENGVKKVEKNATLAIKRKSLVIMPTLTIPATVNAVVKDAATTEDVNKALENAVTEGNADEPKEVIITINSNSNLGEDEEASATVEVSAPIEIPAAITAPATDSEGEGGEGEGGEGVETPVATPTVKITFDEVPQATAATDNKVVLTDNQNVEEVESTESKSNVEVAIPEAPAGVEPPSFEISLPTTTVTLTATQETATFNEVWATTADNTLNVAKGVTIKNLFILSGNVEVTGRIDNITNNSGKTVYVRVSGSGSVGNVTGDVSIIREGDDINTDFENESVADGQTIPYEIANLEQLRSLANRVEAARVNSESRPYADCFYVLTSDIDLGKDMLWKPIGTENHSFAGVFNGNGHTITGIMNLGECDNAGFFGRIHRNGTVKNLTIAADIQIINEDVSTSNVVGGFAGNVDRAIFENCHHTGNISIHTGNIGGFVGTSTGGTFRLCSNTGNLTNLNIHGTVGGMIGIDNGSNLTGCYSTGDITLDKSSGNCGGIVGNSYSGATITACWASGTFLAREIGGMFGHGNNYKINSCYWSENIGGIGNGSWYPTNTGTFEGSAPTEEQINYMNVYIVSLGWMYKEDGSLSPIEGNNIPSNPVRPW
ncbi:MAG: hypothetical protein IJZ38_11675 [Bacteroides sp.]|nr:hypothetical protein [Bacteroides sp.]